MNGHELLVQTLAHLPPSVSAYAEGDELIITAGNQQARLAIVIRQIHRKESLQQLEKRPDRVLICNPLSDFLAEQCSAQGINFIDAAGNARVQSEGLYLWISGRTAAAVKQPARAGWTAATVRCVFALLVDPALQNASIRTMADCAGVSVGVVSNTLALLKAEGLSWQCEGQSFVRQQPLIHEWLSHYRSQLRAKLGGVRLSAPLNWHDIVLVAGDLWGGEVAAELLTEYLQAEQLMLFTEVPLAERIRQLRCKPDAAGRLWLVPAFWGQRLTVGKRGQALLAIAELLASGDSRNIEAAEKINEHFLHLKTLPTPWV
ncbi:type IV toxin-antitoxin system AbiEi family antitoxin [Pokkaliibacter sp. MBI-7]|uniref:type IV toxin-antitoxin system AbiEi family antitoxin n=1 Tax=Pokkaliibacter sp. MBI-7 TaxID=3040600 RepID=UPI00244D22BC|nr:type IV toxin-antitoxin system AbiEi family antitoxin [Pokkaliibacter sp. MBI-7]MDH2433774.1 type IV toxin-antitoxin system AbiEi family antitoxin [Pokkaliibacter sp. MBI-7]